MQNIKKISKLVKNLHNDAEIEAFFKELLTESEIKTLSKRWRILEMLNNGLTQREIAKDLQVSLCKITRGAKLLKDNKSILAKYFKNNTKI
jgi:TrpR family trp operon transcriptional repressor